jgi:hypothetical protein
VQIIHLPPFFLGVSFLPAENSVEEEDKRKEMK